ncbi:hypothetical protein T06_7378 [Trichinella sp. T6]|nr:hypothetical protein T06_7378 [Trichinella sp. T6]
MNDVPLLRSDFLLTYYSNPKSYCDRRHRFFTHGTLLRRNYCKITAYCVRQVNNDVSNGKLNASNVDLNVEVFSNVSSCSAFGLSYSLEDSNNA